MKCNFKKKHKHCCLKYDDFYKEGDICYKSGVCEKTYCSEESNKGCFIKYKKNNKLIECPKFRCGWICRIGFKMKCGGVSCRVEIHGVEYEI